MPNGCVARMIYPIMEPTWRNMQWRLGEEEFLETYEKEVYTFDVDDANAIFVRPVAEFTTDRRRCEISDFLQKHPNKKVINHIDRFLDHDSKNRSFDIWRRNGIKCPNYKICRDVSDVEEFGKLHDYVLMRTNNHAEGRHKWFLENHTINTQARRWLHTAEQEEERSDTRMLLVEFLGPPNGDHCHCRSFVVGEEIICSYALGMETRNGKPLLREFKRFIDQNVRLEHMLQDPDNIHTIVRASTLLGCDTSAVDYIIIDDNIYFLEVNAFWGMGWMPFPFRGSWVREMGARLGELRKIIPHACDRYDINWFWDVFYDRLLKISI